MPVIKFKIPLFLGFAKKLIRLRRTLPRNNFTIPPKIALKIFLTGDKTRSSVF